MGRFSEKKKAAIGAEGAITTWADGRYAAKTESEPAGTE